jgi:hypothetical protein
VNLSTVRGLISWRIHVNRILKSVIFIIAAVYIGVDAVFLTVAKPVADWVSKRRILEGLRAWIASLRPYPTLALFMVPLIALEPLKPVAAYLVATGHVRVALTTFVVGEILKLVILERLFAISRDKLMLIPAFGCSYRRFCQIRNWLEATDAWQAARRWSKVAPVRSYVRICRRRGGHLLPISDIGVLNEMLVPSTEPPVCRRIIN